MMTLEKAKEILSLVDYKDLKGQQWQFYVGRYKDGEIYLQVRFTAPDSRTGVEETQHCRKWHLSQHCTKSEVVTTAFAALERAVLHEVRERFTYKGQTIFNSHWDVDALHRISEERGDSLQERRLSETKLAAG
jgi:hypothetical protein